ncbi:MAG: response regulator [Leptolyngbyaceae bacterium]|nr:response regulator [Leptolyngbyaceae bacterium]
MTKILIAEDERIIAWNIQEVLQVTGHQVISSVSTAEEAIAIASQEQPDLVLMDIRLGGELDGIAAAEEIYTSYGIPSIYLTAHADDYTVERAVASAPFGYVLKPFKRNELLLAIKVAIKRHQSEIQGKPQQTSSLILDHLGDRYLADGVDYFLNAPAADFEATSQEKTPSSDENLSLSKIEVPLASQLTSVIRRSLDDKLIISSMTRALGQKLHLRACHVSIHPFKSSNHPTIISTFCQGTPDLTHFALDDLTRTAVFHELARQQPVQFCVAIRNDSKSSHANLEERLSVLVCPLLNQNGAVIGDIMVMREADMPWNPADITEVCSVADQCLIALRQSLLYQVVQQETKKNHQQQSQTPLSDQWISSLSHELRTPIANIKMASQMLELLVNSLENSERVVQPAKDYFRILQYECERETRLVDALVEVNQDSTTQVLTFNVIPMRDLIEDVLQSYAWQASQKRQRLEFHGSDDIVQWKTAPSVLKRVLSELLDYSCRYSALDGVIDVKMKRVSMDAFFNLHPSAASLRTEASKFGSPSYAMAGQTARMRQTRKGHDSDGQESEGHERGGIEISISHTNPYASASDLNAGLNGFHHNNEHCQTSHHSTGLGLFLAKIQAEKLAGMLEIYDSDSSIVFAVYLPDDPENL